MSSISLRLTKFVVCVWRRELQCNFASANHGDTTPIVQTTINFLTRASALYSDCETCCHYTNFEIKCSLHNNELCCASHYDQSFHCDSGVHSVCVCVIVCGLILPSSASNSHLENNSGGRGIYTEHWKLLWSSFNSVVSLLHSFTTRPFVEI